MKLAVNHDSTPIRDDEIGSRSVSEERKDSVTQIPVQIDCTFKIDEIGDEANEIAAATQAFTIESAIRIVANGAAWTS
jgi:hypothetical protein